jgi:hypothetical protein
VNYKSELTCIGAPHRAASQLSQPHSCIPSCFLDDGNVPVNCSAEDAQPQAEKFTCNDRYYFSRFIRDLLRSWYKHSTPCFCVFETT